MKGTDIKFPNNVSQNTDIASLGPENKVVFKNGNIEDVDTIIFCTGDLFSLTISQLQLTFEHEIRIQEQFSFFARRLQNHDGRLRRRTPVQTHDQHRVPHHVRHRPCHLRVPISATRPAGQYLYTDADIKILKYNK